MLELRELFEAGCGGTQPLIPNKVSMDAAFAGAYETLCLTSAPASPRARLLFGAVL